MSTHPNLLPSSEVFASSFSPQSPSTPTRARRSRSPRPRETSQPTRSHTPRSFRNFLTPRILSPVILWALVVYLVHHFIIPLPFPSLPSRSSKPSASAYFLSTIFPPPPNRLGDDSLDSKDPRYRPLVPLPPPEAPFPRLRPTRFLPPRCMEQWFADGETTCGAADLGPEETLDVTWLWVNGSDPRWRNALIAARKEAGVYSPEHHFREQNELKYSMRSVLAALPGKVRTMHLITADLPVTEDDAHLIPSDHDAPWRLAQAPVWLDYSKRDPASPWHPKFGKSYPSLRYAAHSEIFHLPTYDRNGNRLEIGEQEWKEEQWRAKALPSFNSMAIESRIGWLQGLADVSLSLNDDFFLLLPHSVADFHSPLYGSVFRFDPNYYQQVHPKLDPKLFHEAGENGGLYHANWLLSQRFPKRLRPYFAHVPKVITRGLHHEASLMFAEAITTSTARRFRELDVGHGDVQMQWLLSSLRVERWREALLWTYVVANLGRQGFWAADARAEIEEMFGLTPEDIDVIKIEVHRGERWTLEQGRMNKVFEQAGWAPPKATDFLFSSMDGHVPPLPRPGTPPSNDKCLLDLDRCFGGFWTRGDNVTSADMFARLSFQYPECGDCMIMALVTASGPLGLSAFLPPKGATFRNRPSTTMPRYLPPPHLPLTSTWQEADFSLESVLATTSLPEEEVDLRQYTMKLLSRYQYLSGHSPHHFHMLTNPEHATRVFRMINNNPRVSILGLNDDIVRGYDEVVAMMQEWFESKWPKKAAWER